MSAELILVAAIDARGGVGKGGEIPWRCPKDMKRFRALTLGGSVCYGTRTWKSLPANDFGIKMLGGRYNILITRRGCDSRLFDPNGSIAGSVKEALEIVKAQGLGPLFVLGGEGVWQEALELGAPTMIYLTHVQSLYGCDTFFPKMLATKFKVMADYPATTDGAVVTKFKIYANF